MISAVPQDRRIHKSKAALKDAMLHLLHLKEFRHISITDIVQQADLNRGTFYKHYQYKEELLEDIVLDVTGDLILAFRQPYRDSEAFELGKMGAGGIKLFDHVLKHAQFYMLINRSSALFPCQERIIQVLKKLSLQDLGDPSRHPVNLNPEMQAGYHAYAILGMIMEWVNEGFVRSADYMAEQLAEILQLERSEVVIRPRIADLRLEPAGIGREADENDRN